MTRQVSQNARNAFQMLQGMGYKPHVAAGLVGNLMQESGWDINTKAVGDNGNSFGAVQWNGPRRRAFKQWAAQNGFPESGLGTQIAYLDHEMKTSERGAYDALMGTGTVQEAAVTGSRKFWRPGDPRNKNRMKYAQAVLTDAIQTGAIGGGGGSSNLVGASGGDMLQQPVMRGNLEPSPDMMQRGPSRGAITPGMVAQAGGNADLDAMALEEIEAQRALDALALQEIEAQRQAGQLAQPSQPKSAWDTFMDGVRAVTAVTTPFNQRMVDTATLGVVGDEFEAGLRSVAKGEDYDAALERRRQVDDKFAEEHPNLAVTADVLGGAALAGTAKGPIMAADTLGGRVAVGALEGGSVGGTLGFTQSRGGVGSRAEGSVAGAAGGAAVGAALPPLADIGGAAVRGALSTVGIGNTDKQAARLIAQNLPEKALEPQIPGKPDTLLDLGGENIRRLADTTRAVPSKGGEYMSDFLEDRVATQNNRINGDAAAYLGKTGIKFFRTVQDVVKTRKAQAGPLYKRLEKRTLKVDGPIAQGILRRPAMQDALKKAAKTYYNKTGVQIDLEADRLPFAIIDQAKKELDKAIRWGKTPDGAAAGADTAALKSLQRQFLNLADSQLSGYARARSIYSGSAAIEDAMDEGRKFLKGDSDEMFEEFSKLSRAEKDAFRLGVARQLQDMVEKTPDGADAARKLINSEFVRDRLQMVTPGHGAFKKFLANLQRESGYAQVRNDVLKGSPTQHRKTASDMVLAGAEAVGTGTVTGVLSAVKNALLARAKGINKATADRISRLLVDEDPQKVMRFLQTNVGKQFVKKVGGHVDDDTQFILIRASAGLLGQDVGEAALSAIPN